MHLNIAFSHFNITYYLFIGFQIVQLKNLIRYNTYSKENLRNYYFLAILKKVKYRYRYWTINRYRCEVSVSVSPPTHSISPP